VCSDIGVEISEYFDRLMGKMKLLGMDYVGPSGLWGGAFDSLMMPLDFPRTMP
jgi:hypothetical protein